MKNYEEFEGQPMLVDNDGNFIASIDIEEFEDVDLIAQDYADMLNKEVILVDDNYEYSYYTPKVEEIEIDEDYIRDYMNEMVKDNE